MLRYLAFLITLIALSFISCRNDFNFEPNTGNLSFSRDTVYLDTVFSTISSSTYTLKVYNKTNKNIAIPKIQLKNGENSKYRLMVDGIPGKKFENVELLSKDSLFVFIEVTANTTDVNPSDFLYTDQIQFGNTANAQTVELVTLIQDAYFIYPKRNQNPDKSYTYEALDLGIDEEGSPILIKGQVLDELDPINGNELRWNNTKPYVIYGYAAIPNNKTLIVDAGARIHFHAESGLIVTNNASLQVNGLPSETEALEKEVIFEGDRLEPEYAEIPGQWGAVWFTQGSTNNNISNLTIKNATIGMLVSGNDGSNTPTLNINNTQIYNCTNFGILAQTAHITGKNIVINNAGEASLSCSYGGAYNFTHCTFANYWQKPNQFAVSINDHDGSPMYALTQANFKNCIVYGSPNYSLLLNKTGTIFNYQFENCLIKFADFNNQYASDILYDFNGDKYTNCLITSFSNPENPDFKNPDKNELIIGENSAAKEKGIYDATVSKDILNNNRDNPSDIGAYNFTTFD